MDALDRVAVSMFQGLTAEECALLRKLLNVWHDKLPKNQLQEEYYEQRHRPVDLGIAIPPQLRNFKIANGWARKAVDMLAERSVFEGFVLGDGSTSEIDDILLANDFTTTYDQACTSELIHSCSAITVSRGAEGEPSVLISAYSATECSMIWDYRKKRIKAGLVVIDVDEKNINTVLPTWVNLYTDDYTLTCRKVDNKWITERYENVLGRPLMEPLVYRPTVKRPFGQSRITPAVRAIVDCAMRESLRTEIAAEFYTTPQKYIIGIDPDTFGDNPSETEYNKVKAYLGSILALTPNSNGDNPQVGQFSQMSMQPHTEYLQQLAKEFSAETGIPTNSLGVITDNPTSAEAMYAAEGDLIVAAERLNRQNGRSLSNVAKLALCAQRGCRFEDLTLPEQQIQAVFADETRPSGASRASFAQTIASTVPEYAQTAQFWRDLGYTEPEIRALRAEVRAASDQSVLSALITSARPLASSQEQTEEIAIDNTEE